MTRLRSAWLLLALSLAFTHSAAAQFKDRWQLTLRSTEIIFECYPIALQHDTLVVTEADSQRALPLDSLSELRILGSSPKVVGAGAPGVFAGLIGAGDEVHELERLPPEERRAVVRQAIWEHPRPSTPQ